ncbi:hypothetical protein HYY74_04280 [Candidatus Woesearchaeota archaeon]|nr:hypothetical protein [Candidatus Woesearchaeota archaeon]
MVKQGFLRTMEAAAAIVITFFFLIIFIPHQIPGETALKNDDVLTTLSKDPAFRECVTQENSTCVNDTLRPYMQQYSYTFNVSRTGNAQPRLPEKQVISESAYIAGNDSLYSPRIIRIYYWPRE